MKSLKTVSVFSLVLLWAAAAVAQDPVKVAPANYKVLVDNASVRVLKIDYAPGAKSAMHEHPDAIVVPLTASKVRFTMADGKTQESDLPNDSAMYTPAATHSPMNVGTGRVDAILVEFKGAGGKAVLPTAREGMTIKVLAEGPRATAYKSTAGPGFQEPAGTKHDYDQVVIALANTQMSLSVDGKPAKTSWARGDVAFIGRGVAHESKNTSGKPVDYVIVAVK
jgi:quercetin dioxygenase-like cupin family protein